MDPTTLWEMAKPILAGQARHALTVAAGALLAHGALQASQENQFVEIGMSLAGWAVVAGWSWWNGVGKARAAALLQKMTGTDNHKDAVEAAKALPDAAAVDTRVKAVTANSVTSGPIATLGNTAAVLLVAFALAACLAGSPAMAQNKLKLPIDPLGLNEKTPLNILPGNKLTGSAITDLQSALNAKLLPDLQYALKLAQASNNTVTSDCFQAWIDIITSQQNAVKNADGTDLAMPDPHLITDFEKLVELRNALQPESKFNVKCSPVASMLKRDLASFMGIVISGGAGLATLVPGL